MLNNKGKLLYSSGPQLFLFFVATILLWPVIIKHDSFLLGFENRHMAYTYMFKLNNSLRHGYFPMWDASTYGGKSFLGEFQPGIFYPLNILMCLLFGSADGLNPYGIDLLVVLHYFIALFGMYAAARLFKLPPAAAIVSALVYAFTGHLQTKANGDTNVFYGLCLLPWAVYFVVKYYQTSRKRKYLVFSGLIGGMQILAGHITPFYHTLFIEGVIIIFYEYESRKNWISFFSQITVNFLLVVAAALFITIPQLYYSYEYMSLSYRWIGAPDGTPLKPGQKVPYSIFAYLYIFNPTDYGNFLGKYVTRPTDGNSIYMGISSFLLLAVYLIKCRYIAIRQEYKSLTKLMVIIAVIGIASTLGYMTFLSRVLWTIPLASSFRELARYSLLMNVSFAVLAGLAVANIEELRTAMFLRSSRVKFYALLLLAFNALYLVIYQTKMIDRSVSIPFFCAFLFFLLLQRSSRSMVLYTAFIAVLLIDLYLNQVDRWAIDSNYPTTFFKRNRIIDSLEKSYGKYRVSYEIDNIETSKPNLGNIYKIQTRLGFCATMNMKYFDFLSTNWDPHSEAYDLLNVKYIVTDKLLDSSFIFLDSLPKTYLYERKTYYPRIYWKSQLGKSGQEIEKENEGSIRQLAYEDMYQKVQVVCQTPDTLVFSENCYPGWKCYDNGRQVPISAATIKNYPSMFRAIYLDKGTHSIEFKYAQLFQWSRNTEK